MRKALYFNYEQWVSAVIAAYPLKYSTEGVLTNYVTIYVGKHLVAAFDLNVSQGWII